ncbi:MAG: tRNA pseudouridine(55) synthase TruB [Clostridia bacterium]|nr:tRNA pseudouridine(55) synthase TruB [Clostridia bacterium]
MNGIIVIDKPKDFTSFDVVAVMRGIARTKKVGHTGTLDPMATGVLPLLFGNATKVQDILPDTDKEYIADFQLGITTDTLDITGKRLSQKAVNVSDTDIRNILPLFTGDILQTPPMYSAVQVDGKRLYQLARQGITVEREKRKIHISKLELLSYVPQTHTGMLKIQCSKGTYIRTLIDDIGNMLKCGGTMTALCRTYACSYHLKDAVSLETAKELARQNNLESVLRSVEDVFTQYRWVKVSDLQAKRFSNGGRLDLNRLYLNDFLENEIIRVKTLQNQFLGLGRADIQTQQLCLYKLFSNV